MTKLEQYRDIAKRLEEATGPDRVLALDVLLAVGWKNKGPSGRNIDCPYEDVGEVWLAPYGPIYWFPSKELPRVTYSIDAALELVERVLPDFAFTLEELVDEVTGKTRGCMSELMQKEWAYYKTWYKADAPTAPIAILKALFAALIAQEESK